MSKIFISCDLCGYSFDKSIDTPNQRDNHLSSKHSITNDALRKKLIRLVFSEVIV